MPGNYAPRLQKCRCELTKWQSLHGTCSYSYAHPARVHSVTSQAVSPSHSLLLSAWCEPETCLAAFSNCEYNHAACSLAAAAHNCVWSFQPGGEVAGARARLVAKAAAAMAERSPEAVATDLPEAVSLAEIVLNCIALGTPTAPLCAFWC